MNILTGQQKIDFTCLKQKLCETKGRTKYNHTGSDSVT